MLISLSKAQSAVEYLMTYGWMLLAVAVVGGAIFAAVGDQSVDSTSGFSGSDVMVDNFGVSEDDELGLDLRSASGSEIVVSRVNVSDPDTGEWVYKEFTGDNRIGVGSSKIFELPNVSRTDSSNQLDVEISYDSGGLSNLSLSGSVSGLLELTGSGSYEGLPEDDHQSIDDGGDETSDGEDVVSVSDAPTFSTAPSGGEYESSWVPVTANSSVQKGFDYFFNESDDPEYFNVSEGFYVMKYEAKPYNNATDSFDSSTGTVGHNTDYVPRSVAANKPWRDISFNEGSPGTGYGALQACEALDKQTEEFDVHLVTNREWMTVARQIEQNANNWNTTSPSVDGQLVRGWSDGDYTDDAPLRASASDTDSKYGILEEDSTNGWSSDSDIPDHQNRTFELANGEVVWDWAGNVRHWVYAEEDGGSTTNGVFDSAVATDGSDDPVALEYEHDPAVVDRSTNGIGIENDFEKDEAAVRGGDWGLGVYAGTFGAVSLVSDSSSQNTPDGTRTVFGFRCSAVPVS